MTAGVYTIYDNNSIKMVFSGNEEIRDLNMSEGDFFIEGQFTDEYYYVKNGTIKELPEKPEYPCEFDSITESWIWQEDISWNDLREERNLLLEQNFDVVAMNPFRWNSLSLEQQEAYSNYRQALLDLPNNLEDPRNVIWPTPPQ